jgi:hypothetical protein
MQAAKAAHACKAAHASKADLTHDHALLVVKLNIIIIIIKLPDPEVEHVKSTRSRVAASGSCVCLGCTSNNSRWLAPAMAKQ